MRSSRKGGHLIDGASVRGNKAGLNREAWLISCICPGDKIISVNGRSRDGRFLGFMYPRNSLRKIQTVDGHTYVIDVEKKPVIPWEWNLKSRFSTG